MAVDNLVGHMWNQRTLFVLVSLKNGMALLITIHTPIQTTSTFSAFWYRDITWVRRLRKMLLLYAGEFVRKKKTSTENVEFKEITFKFTNVHRKMASNQGDFGVEV